MTSEPFISTAYKTQEPEVENMMKGAEFDTRGYRRIQAHEKPGAKKGIAHLADKSLIRKPKFSQPRTEVSRP
jgi:hypothetical protein